MAAIGRFQKGDEIFYAKVVDGGRVVERVIRVHLREFVELACESSLVRVAGIPLFPFKLEGRNTQFSFRRNFDQLL